MLHSRKDEERFISKRMRDEAMSSADDEEAPAVFKRPNLSQTHLPVSNHSNTSATKVIAQRQTTDKAGKFLSSQQQTALKVSTVESSQLKQRAYETDKSVHSDDHKPLSQRIGTSVKRTPQNSDLENSISNIGSSRSFTTQNVSKITAENARPKDSSKALNTKIKNSDEDQRHISLNGSTATKKSREATFFDDTLQNGRVQKKDLIVQSDKSSRAMIPVKLEEDSDDDKPLSQRVSAKPSTLLTNEGSSEDNEDSEDEKPLLQRLQQNRLADKDQKGKVNKAEKNETYLKKRPLATMKQESDDTDDEDNVPIAQRMRKKLQMSTPSTSIQSKMSASSLKSNLSEKQITKKDLSKTETDFGSNKAKTEKLSPRSGEGQKWTTLEHNGVIFPPPYKPHGVKMLYNGKPVDLTPEQEEVATMFAVMKNTDYAMKKTFRENFWHDWKQILGPKHTIQKFELCDFTPIYEWHLREKEIKKQMSPEEKKALKEEKLKQEEKYMWAVVDGVKEKVGNFRVEPPGLFRGRGEHPKMGKLKRRICPEDITINIGKDAPVPECTLPGHRWKEIRHDNTVTWLAFWNDPINSKEFKYVFLAASSSLKGQSDKEKYEKARTLKNYIDNIRSTYTKNFQSKDETKKQIAVATYLIDRLALRAGNEKDDDEADTVGCCTLKVENVELVGDNKIEFDFLGKDSIRYQNTVEVDPRVYKAIGEFKKGKKNGVDLFDKLDTSKLNTHLKELMPGLTAKVFRTYNASITLDNQLLERSGNDVAEKVAAYQSANKEVAILCNHQRSVSKSFDAQMARLDEKMSELETMIQELETDLMRARKGKPPLKDAEGKQKKNLSPEMLEKKIAKAKERRDKMQLNKQMKDDLKTVALGTSKINYMDPRITVAWCKRNEVPIEKIFNKSLLAKFAWAMDVDPQYRF